MFNNVTFLIPSWEICAISNNSVQVHHDETSEHGLDVQHFGHFSHAFEDCYSRHPAAEFRLLLLFIRRHLRDRYCTRRWRRKPYPPTLAFFALPGSFCDETFEHCFPAFHNSKWLFVVVVRFFGFMSGSTRAHDVMIAFHGHVLIWY